MTDRGPDKATWDRLQAVLAAYGADPARWPEGDRHLASWLAIADSDLSPSLEDAVRLDAVLARASRPVVPGREAERLIAAVNEKPRRVVSLRPGALSRPRARRTALPRRMAVLTALAASLALGVYLGASGQTNWLTPPLLAAEPPESLSAELDVLNGTLQLFEEHGEP
jgi:hypothetical protein